MQNVLDSCAAWGERAVQLRRFLRVRAHQVVSDGDCGVAALAAGQARAMRDPSVWEPSSLDALRQKIADHYRACAHDTVWCSVYGVLEGGCPKRVPGNAGVVPPTIATPVITPVTVSTSGGRTESEHGGNASGAV